jgi:hypothetical protein
VGRRRLFEGLARLERREANLDIRPLAGHPGWLRLRVGDWRVLYRPGEAGWAVERIVDRKNLDRAVATLPE